MGGGYYLLNNKLKIPSHQWTALNLFTSHIHHNFCYLNSAFLVPNANVWISIIEKKIEDAEKINRLIEISAHYKFRSLPDNWTYQWFCVNCMQNSKPKTGIMNTRKYEIWPEVFGIFRIISEFWCWCCTNITLKLM